MGGSSEFPVDLDKRIDRRLRAAVDDNYQFLWRTLRRLGVQEAGIDDALQQVFLVAASKLADVDPERERSFLLSVAIKTAANVRRSQQRLREVLTDGALETLVASDGGPERWLDECQARILLDEALEQMSANHRTVFVLYELEELSASEIAGLLDLPPGTVASRLRLAREEFAAISKRIQARLQRRTP